MKLVLCSERDSIRERWRSVLAEQGYLMHQVAFFESLKQLLLKDDISLILLHQPFADFQTIHELCGRSGSCKVFILADEPKEEDGMFLLRLGVAGYANTYISPGRLSEAVKMILSGRVWFNQQIINKLIQSINAKRKQQGDGDEKGVDSILNLLSGREKEIAVLISEGLSNNEIGDKLFISERTVKSHISTIFNKTGTKSRLQLALLVLRR